MTDENSEKVKKLFDIIAEKYDYNNNIISFGTHKYVKKLSVKMLSLKPDMKILDLCTGTGDIAGFIKKNCPECNVTGLDFSEKMLKIAGRKFPDVKFISGDCTNLPFEDNSFDTVTISFGLRNIENKDTVLQEIYRVLKKDGEFLHLDFGKSNVLLDFAYDKIVPVMVKIFYDNHDLYNQLIKSKKKFMKPDELIKMFANQGFKLKQEKKYLFGMISAIVMSA